MQPEGSSLPFCELAAETTSKHRRCENDHLDFFVASCIEEKVSVWRSAIINLLL